MASTSAPKPSEQKITKPLAPVPQSSFTRIQVLDGLRGISVLLVVLGHSLLSGSLPLPQAATLNVLVSADLGVLFFFVISGFIITTVILREVESTGSISLWNFYKRRFVRLLPSLYLFLAVSLSMAWLTQRLFPSQCWLGAATFTFGIVHQHQCGFEIGHMWSLTVEEVFYLLWPLGVTLSLGRFPKTLLLVFVLCPVLRVLAYMGHTEGPLNGLLETLSHMDQLGVGCVLGYLFFKKKNATRNFFKKYPNSIRLLSFGLIGGVAILSQLGLAGVFTVPLGSVTQAIGFALLLASLLSVSEGRLHSFLQSRPLVYIGTISYGLYLWQQVFMGNTYLSETPLSGLTRFPLNLIAAVLVSHLSFRFLERPVQRWADRSRVVARWGA